MEGARIGLIGKSAKGFQNLFFDRRVIEQRYGVRFYDHELADLFARVRQVPPETAHKVAEEMVAGMEEGLAQFDDMDTSGFTEEQLAEIENQRQALDEAKKEMDTQEFKNQKERVDMVSRIREELLD